MTKFSPFDKNCLLCGGSIRRATLYVKKNGRLGFILPLVILNVLGRRGGVVGKSCPYQRHCPERTRIPGGVGMGQKGAR